MFVIGERAFLHIIVLFLMGHHYKSVVFIVKLSTEARLNICQPAQILSRNNPWNNPILFAAFDNSCGKWLSDNFYKAFGENIIPNILNGATIPLCIGPEVSLLEEFGSERERINAYANILESYKQVQDQGDGIKSFTGILLYLMMENYCTFLIDEPESFLHPPQARILGQIIGSTIIV